jgi:hypothetical protein
LRHYCGLPAAPGRCAITSRRIAAAAPQSSLPPPPAVNTAGPAPGYRRQDCAGTGDPENPVVVEPDLAQLTDVELSALERFADARLAAQDAQEQGG